MMNLAHGKIDVARIRQDFPILQQEINGHPLVYLDNAATTQKPRAVIEAEAKYYEATNANVHRAIHTLGERATAEYEAARARVARFIGAPAPQGVVFTRNATEAINLVAYAWGLHHLRPGDEVVTTEMEHHSNFLPWQQVTRWTGAALRVVGITEDGQVDMEEMAEAITPRTRLVAVTHVSNVLGTINPVADIARLAHAAGALVLVDGAQSVPHMPVSVTDLECDFLAFSGHKMFGPMGIGVLWGRPELLDRMEPFLFGGEMINEVTLRESTWAEVPWKFEAGTPNVAGAVGLAAAMDYIDSIGRDAVQAWEAELTRYALDRIATVPGVTIYGPRRERGALVAFIVEGAHPHDLSTFLDQKAIAIRAGHHCAQPLHACLGTGASARASFAVYNTKEEIDLLVEALEQAKEFFDRVLGRTL